MLRHTRSAHPGSILSALLCAIILAPAASADVKLDATTGFDNTYRPDSWTPVAISLSGTGTNASGVLQVAVSSREGTSTYSKPLHLHAGPLNEQHVIYYLHTQSYSGPPTSVTAQLLVEGRKVAEKKLDKTFSLTDTQPVIVALTQDRSGLSFLTKLDLGRAHIKPGGRSIYNQFGNNPQGNPAVSTGNNPVRVLYPLPATLPDASAGYNAIDAVMLGDMSLDAITEDQWNAIVRWVRDGGVLVVSGGPDTNRLRNPQLAGILPITPTGPKQLTDFSRLEDRYELPFKSKSSTVMSGVLKQDAIALCTQGSLPLVSYRRLGNGLVMYTAFDITSPEFKAWEGHPNLWHEVLKLGIGEIRATQVMSGVMESVNPWGYGRAGGDALADALAGRQSTEAPSFTFIGLFLLLYIIFLVPVNYYLLRKKDRKELAWVTAPLIIAVFSTGAYAIGYSVKGGQLFMRFASVVEGTANQEGWDAYTIASVFSPRQTRYDISMADPAAPVSDVTSAANQFGRGGVQDISVVRDKKTTVRDALINMWDHRNFGFESHVDLGVIAASAVSSQGGIAIHVTNNTGRALTDCIVNRQGQFVRVGNLQPGESSMVTLNRSGGGTFGKIGQLALDPAPGQGNTQSAIKQAMASTLQSNEIAGVGADPLLFTGWLSEPIGGLTLENETPKVEGVTLVVVHIPPVVTGGTPAAPSFKRPKTRPDPFSPQRR